MNSGGFTLHVTAKLSPVSWFFFSSIMIYFGYPPNVRDQLDAYILAPLTIKATYAAIALTFLTLFLTSNVRAERLPLKIYTVADGLGHNNVNRIVRDSRGFLWFCTFEGLSRFDGYTFTTYGVTHGLRRPIVNDLLETRQGLYWVATAEGLYRFNPKGIPQRASTNGGPSSTNAMFTVYYPGDDSASNDILTLFEDSRGVIWCGTANGLYRLQEQNGKPLLSRTLLRPSNIDQSPDLIDSIIEDKHGALWLGSGHGIYRLLPDGRTQHYSHEHNGLPSDEIHSLLEDRDGRLWVSTRDGGLFVLVSDPDPSNMVVARLYTERDGLPRKWINQLFQASDGNIWAGSNAGLIQFIKTADGRDFRFRAYAQPEGLSHQEVQALAEDRNGNLWLGMNTGGAIKLARSGVTAFAQEDGFKWANAIFKDRAGDLCVIGSRTFLDSLVNRFDGDRFTAVHPKVPYGFAGWGWNQLLLEDHAGEWWYASGHGLYRFPKVGSFGQLRDTPPKAIYTTRDGLAGEVILRVFEDSRGDIWVGTVDGFGLSRWDRATETFHHYKDGDGLPSSARFYPISFWEDSAGAIWIGFNNGGGLVRYRDGRFTRFTSEDGLPDGGIFNLFIDSSGRLWIPTTRGGVGRIDDPTKEHPGILTITTEQGLSSNDVRSVTEDRWGRMYFGTGRGIDRFNPKNGSFKYYTAGEGVLLGDVLAAMQDREGALWFSFPTGLIRLVPEPERASIPPPVLITALRIAGDEQPVSALGETEIAPVELSADRSQLQIDFVALGFSPGEGLKYQFKLEGSKQDWSPLSEQRSVNFASLTSGSYRFIVRAISADGVMSETPASFAFRILPPIWQRWWFIAIVATLTGLLFYALYRHRVARLVELERVRTRIAADLHDDIGSSLAQISILSEVLRKQLGVQEAPTLRNLSLIARVSHEALDSMSDIVWAINPMQDHLSDLVRRMRRVASEVLPARDIQFAFNAPTSGLELKLGADIRREVFLMFKETLNNMVRHSGCTRAEIDLNIEGAWLVVTVCDNGKGFDSEHTNEGNGLVSLSRRARSLGGETLLTSQNGNGTIVKIRVPHRHYATHQFR
jgi:ligand-binding sensor domain-containing protein/two-component sensor histidine kinase